MELRPYQSESRQAVHSEWDCGHKRTLLVLPTGTGKTVVFAKIAEDQVRSGERTLILAHRGELLNQAADKIFNVTGLKCAVEKASESCLDSWYRITVGSVQSMMQAKRLSQFPEDYFKTIIIDEAHHAETDGYLRILSHFPDAHVLGVTATPDRGDMKNLGSVFESLAYEYSIAKAIKEGYLVPIKALSIPLKLDISSVTSRAGDFKTSELDTALDPYLYSIADEMIKNCADRKTVVFLPLIKTSQKFCAILNSKGFRAAEVNGQSADRAKIQSDFEKGEYNVLCNSMLLTEGWDCPSVDCVIVLRPTQSRTLYCQMVGRGTRLSEGKKDLLLLDFLWLTSRHELCRPASIIAENAEIAAQMTENIAASGCPVDITEAEVKAQSDVVVKREEALAKKLEKMKKRKRSLVDPLQYEMSIQSSELSGYIPAFADEIKPPSETQLKALEKWGINSDGIDSAGKAEHLIDSLEQRNSMGLATPKQIRLLEQKGFNHVGKWSFDSARKMIARISASGWRVPSGVDPATYIPPMEVTDVEQQFFDWT